VNAAIVLPVVALAVAAVVLASKLRARRRAAKVKVSGGRKALVLNLFER
jgi:hypothetical protein